MALNQRVSIAIDHSPPYAYTDGESRPRGLLIDIMTRLANEVGFSLKIVPCPFSRCLKMVETGQIDMMGGLIFTHERETRLQYLHPAYMSLNSSFVFYALRDSDMHINSYQDLQKKRIATMRSGVYFDRFDKDNTLNKVYVPSEKIAMDMLLRGRVDLVIAVEATTDHAIQIWNQSSHRIKKVAYRHSEKILGHAVLSRKFADRRLADEIDSTMKAIAHSGELDQIVKKYGLPPIDLSTIEP